MGKDVREYLSRLTEDEKCVDGEIEDSSPRPKILIKCLGIKNAQSDNQIDLFKHKSSNLRKSMISHHKV